MMILIAQSFSFATDISQDWGGATLNFSHLSPDKHWKCDEWSYFLSGDEHLCFSHISVPQRNDNYKISLRNQKDWLLVDDLYASHPPYASNMVKIEDSNGENFPYVFINLYDFFETTEDAEFLYYWLSDDDLQLKIDNNHILERSVWAHSANHIPIALGRWFHVVEVWYRPFEHNYWGLASYLVWPFPKGSFFAKDASQRSFVDIQNFLINSGVLDNNAARKNANIVWSITEILNSDKKKQILSEAWSVLEEKCFPLSLFGVNTTESKFCLPKSKQTPGYSCPTGQKPFFARNEDGSYQKVPMCYADITPAKPNKIINGPEIIFDSIVSEPAREKVLRGYVRGERESLLGYKIVDSSVACESLEYEKLSAGIKDYSITLTSESDNGKKLCLKATDDQWHSSYNWQIIYWIVSDVVSVKQWNPIVSRKGVPINIDDITPQYVGNANIPFKWSIIHNAQEQGLDPLNPVKWNYRITYTASNFTRTSIVTVVRPVEITDADTLLQQLIFASDPSTIRDKTPESLDRLQKAKEKAQKVFDNGSALQLEIDKATSDLVEALKQLKNIVKVDTSSKVELTSSTEEKKSRRRSSGRGEMYWIPIEIVKKSDFPQLSSKNNRTKEDYWTRKEEQDHWAAKIIESPVRVKENYWERKEKIHNAVPGYWFFTEDQIFNPTIFDGQCYNRRPLQEIKNSLTLKTSEEFKKSQSFLRSYEMTRYDSIDRFRPKDDLTREEAAKIFSNFAINVLCRKPDTNLKINYRDLENANITLKQYITTAYQLGIMKGAHGNFRPKDKITKKEISATIIRMILKSYLDETKTSTKTRYSEYEKVAKELWILKKDVNDDPLLREYTALMLFRAYKNQPFSWQKLGYETFALKDRDRFVK